MTNETTRTKNLFEIMDNAKSSLTKFKYNKNSKSFEKVNPNDPKSNKDNFINIDNDDMRLSSAQPAISAVQFHAA